MVVIGIACARCGEPVLADDDFCERCGRPLADPARDHAEVVAATTAAVSDRGHVHARNEDAFHLAEAAGRVVAVVCDGVSTCAAPHVAASTAAAAAGEALAAGADVIDAVTTADEAVRAIASSDDSIDPPSTTIAAAYTDHTGIHVSWLGDSRAYWITDGEATLLTSDHSWAEERRATGAPLAPDDPAAHMITRWLGAGSPDGAPPSVSVVPALGGRLLLCTDGLWNHVADAELATLGGLGTPPDAARALVAVALDRGGTDNVTVVIMDPPFRGEEAAP